MKIIKTWTDDHLPCVSFMHNDKKYELCWTERGFVGRLELVQEGDVTLEKAAKKYPELLAALNGKLAHEELDDKNNLVWYLDAGCLTQVVNKPKRK